MIVAWITESWSASCYALDIWPKSLGEREIMDEKLDECDEWG
jgi:hypothetical protein